MRLQFLMMLSGLCLHSTVFASINWRAEGCNADGICVGEKRVMVSLSWNSRNRPAKVTVAAVGSHEAVKGVVIEPNGPLNVGDVISGIGASNPDLEKRYPVENVVGVVERTSFCDGYQVGGRTYILQNEDRSLHIVAPACDRDKK